MGITPHAPGLQADAGAVEVEDGVALEDVEAFLVRVDVHIDAAARVELDEAETHVHRPGMAADELRATQPHRPVHERHPRPRILRRQQKMTN